MNQEKLHKLKPKHKKREKYCKNKIQTSSNKKNKNLPQIYYYEQKNQFRNNKITHRNCTVLYTVEYSTLSFVKIQGKDDQRSTYQTNQFGSACYRQKNNRLTTVFRIRLHYNADPRHPGTPVESGSTGIQNVKEQKIKKRLFFCNCCDKYR